MLDHRILRPKMQWLKECTSSSSISSRFKLPLIKLKTISQKQTRIQTWKDRNRSLRIKRVICSSGRTRIDVELVLMLKGFKLVCMTSDKDVYVQLPLYDCQALHVTPWHHLMTMAQANAELTNGHNLLLWVIDILENRGKNPWYIISGMEFTYNIVLSSLVKHVPMLVPLRLQQMNNREIPINVYHLCLLRKSTMELLL